MGSHSHSNCPWFQYNNHSIESRTFLKISRFDVCIQTKPDEPRVACRSTRNPPGVLPCRGVVLRSHPATTLNVGELSAPLSSAQIDPPLLGLPAVTHDMRLDGGAVQGLPRVGVPRLSHVFRSSFLRLLALFIYTYIIS